MQNMIFKIAVVKQIVGEVVAISPDGSTRVLHKGDEIFLGDIIKTAVDAKVRIDFDDGEVARIGFNSVFKTTNVFAEHNGELVIPGLQKDEKSAEHENSENESNIHYGGSNLSSQTSLNNASFSQSGHYANIFDSIKQALISDKNDENSFNAPVSSIKGAPTQATKSSKPFIDNVPKFYLDVDTNKDGIIGKYELLASPETTKVGNNFYTPMTITLPPAAKTGDIIKIKSGSQTLKYKINLDNNELIQVDDSGTPVPGSVPQPLADGKIDATEMGVGEDAIVTDVKYLVPNDMKTGDKIKSIVTGANGDSVTKIYTINKENNTATDEAGNVYPLKPNGKGAMAFDVPNGAVITPDTELKTQFIDRFGNEGDIKQQLNTISNKAEATLSADTDKDGVINKDELKNGESSVDIHLPNSMKLGESVKITINTGAGTPVQKEFVLSPDKKASMT